MLLPFSLLDLFDPAVPGLVPPGAHCYAFHLALSAEDKRQADSKFSHVLMHVGLDLPNFHITSLSGTGKHSYVQITSNSVCS